MRFVCLLILVGCGVGCGLVQQRAEFRTYPLQDIAFEDGVDLVREVTERFMTERFGGVGIEWDPTNRNLRVDPVYDQSRRMTLHIHLESSPVGMDVEMLAVVQHLLGGTRADGLWGEPQQDIPLEQMLYDALLAEYLARQG